MILAVNGNSVVNKAASDVMQLIMDQSGPTITLDIWRLDHKENITSRNKVVHNVMILAASSRR